MSPRDPNAPLEVGEAKSLLASVQKQPLDDEKKSALVLWIVHRKLVNREAQYRLQRLGVDEELSKRLREDAVRQVRAANHLRPYEFETSDQDDIVFFESISHTDMADLIQTIGDGTKIPTVSRIEDLIGAFAYIVEIAAPAGALFAFRKVSTTWSLKKQRGIHNALFKGKVLAMLKGRVFPLDRRFDFFTWGDAIFILEKHSFEQGLNFRLGMEAKRDRLVAHFESAKSITDVEPIKRKCSEHLRYLRKVAAIEKNGYYRDVAFLADLQKIAAVRKWPLSFRDGKLEVTDANVVVVLTVLNNDRLESPINKELFDVDGAKSRVV